MLSFEKYKILVLGSLCAHPEDRRMNRHSVITAQILFENNFIPVSFYNGWGELGLSSIDWNVSDPLTLYITTGNDIIRHNIQTNSVYKYEIPNLKDVHEISIIDNSLWITNTAEDEIIEFDLKDTYIKQRIKLNELVKNKSPLSKIKYDPSSVVVDKFHCNQVIKAVDGYLYSLTHHVTGKQLIRQIAQKLLKNHGSGGVINIGTGDLYKLKLKAPHNIRLVNNSEYWIFSSGDFRIKIYDLKWNYKRSIETKGWGRGAVVTPDRKYFFAGISATRRRYKSVIPIEKQVPNMIQIFSTTDNGEIASIKVPNVEQINNLYLLNDNQYNCLLKLLC